MPETFVYDYSSQRPDPVSMKVSGADGVVRYLAPLPNPKVIDAAERDRLLAAGLSITLIWESVAQRALAGANAGTVDAHTAIGMAQALGYPDDAAIYYCLEDPSKLPRSQWPKVLAYIEAVAAVGGPYRRGGYGSQDLVEETLRQGFITKGWQVEGWSAGVSMTCHLFQRSNSRNHPFPGTDENVCLQPDWGQWSPNSVPEDDMTPAQDMILHDLQNRALTDVERDSLFGAENGMYARLLRVERAQQDQAKVQQALAAQSKAQGDLLRKIAVAVKAGA